MVLLGGSIILICVPYPHTQIHTQIHRRACTHVHTHTGTHACMHGISCAVHLMCVQARMTMQWDVMLLA